MLWGSFGLAGAVRAISQEIAYLGSLYLCYIDSATAMRWAFMNHSAAESFEWKAMMESWVLQAYFNKEGAHAAHAHACGGLSGCVSQEKVSLTVMRRCECAGHTTAEC